MVVQWLETKASSEHHGMFDDFNRVWNIDSKEGEAAPLSKEVKTCGVIRNPKGQTGSTQDFLIFMIFP